MLSRAFFAILTKRRIKRGVFRSIIALQGAINRYIADQLSAVSVP